METEKPKSNNDFRSCLCKDITRSSESKQTHSYLQTGGGGIEGGHKSGVRGPVGAMRVKVLAQPALLSPEFLSVKTPHRHTTYVKIKMKSMGNK